MELIDVENEACRIHVFCLLHVCVRARARACVRACACGCRYMCVYVRPCVRVLLEVMYCGILKEIVH